MSLVAKVIGGIGIVSFSCFAGWVQGRALHLEKDKKGSLLIRMGQTVFAALQRRRMQDQTAAAKHVALVASLSCRKNASEKDPAYYPGYLFETIAKAQGKEPLVFRHNNTFPTHFIYSGPSSNIHDKEARMNILQGRYVRCSFRYPAHERKEAILTGVIDRRACSTFQASFMKEMVLSASQKNEAPLPFLRVFEISGSKLRLVGDLSNLPEDTKKTISLENFTLCAFSSTQDVLVVGVKNRKVCRDARRELKIVILKEWVR